MYTMVFTKRMKTARMNPTCCWNGGQSVGLVGKNVALANHIARRTYQQSEGSFPLVLTCSTGIVFTFTENTLTASNELEYYYEMAPEIYNFSLVSRTSNSITGNIDGTFTFEYDNDNILTRIFVTETGEERVPACFNP